MERVGIVRQYEESCFLVEYKNSKTIVATTIESSFITMQHKSNPSHWLHSMWDQQSNSTWYIVDRACIIQA